LGKHLKDDDVIEILEAFDLAVRYDFDRTHENIEDRYWAEAIDHGFILRFDQRQALDTVFLYCRPKDDYTPIDRTEIDVPVYESIAVAERAGTAAALPYSRNGEMKMFPGVEWIKFDRGTHSVHYQFDNGELSMITLARKGNAKG